MTAEPEAAVVAFTVTSITARPLSLLPLPFLSLSEKDAGNGEVPESFRPGQYKDGSADVRKQW